MFNFHSIDLESLFALPTYLMLITAIKQELFGLINVFHIVLAICPRDKQLFPRID